MAYMWPVHLWNHWSIEILVLFSLALQLVLFLFSGIRRRREAYQVLRLLLWLAYLLADSTAIYALGHLSISNTARQHQLAAFWAPFLILHLGGPDSITAYSLEDNQLWLRHLLMFFVQVLGAAYVVYKNIAGSGTFFVLATTLMFIVGVVMFGERTWALKRGNVDSIRSSVTNSHIICTPSPEGAEAEVNQEYLARLAHSLFDICKRAVADSPVVENRDYHDLTIFQDLPKEYKYAVIGMELSLMYDIMYTKAAVIHSWPGGFWIRVASPLATIASLVLFQLSNAKEGQIKLDIAVTYSLLAGAFLLETTSLLSFLGSTWFLCATQSTQTWCCWWTWLRKVAVSHDWIAKMIGNGSCRLSGSWPGTMGQYNMLHLCARRDFSPLLGRLAKMLCLMEWWEKKHYSGTVKIPEMVRELVFDHIHRTITQENLNTVGIIMSKWGENTLNTYELEKILVLRSSLGTEFQEGIIIWHIGTDVFLARRGQAAQDNEEARAQVGAVRAMSNYMMYLLVKRSYMLPGLAQNRLYQQSSDLLAEVHKAREITTSGSWFKCTMLKELFHDDPGRFEQTQSFATWLNDNMPRVNTNNSHLNRAIELADALVDEEALGTNSLELVCKMWADFLVHAANRCSRESHARKLNSGGEFTTLIWLLTEHFHQLLVSALARFPNA